MSQTPMTGGADADAAPTGASGASAAFLPGMAGAGAGQDAPPPPGYGGAPSGIGGKGFAAALLGGAVSVAGAGLWFMRKIGMAVTLSAGQADAPEIPEFEPRAAVVTEDRDGLLDDLTSSGDFPQVPLEQVQMNPFTLKGLAVEDDPIDAPDLETEAERLARERAERLAKLQRIADGLSVNSVMGGPRPLAVVSGQMVGVGDVIADAFRVAAIADNTVTLDALREDDFTVAITMVE